MTRKLTILLFTFLSGLAHSGCAHSLAREVATRQPRRTATHPPTSTRPVNSTTPKRTLPPPTPVCRLDPTLAKVARGIPYEAFVLTYHALEGKPTLVVWYVDPELDPVEGAEGIEAALEAAVEGALVLCQHIVHLDACVLDVFSAINPIVVDPRYHGWFSGSIDPRVFTPGATIEAADLLALASAFEVGYMRTAPLTPPAASSPPEGA